MSLSDQDDPGGPRGWDDAEDATQMARFHPPTGPSVPPSIEIAGLLTFFSLDPAFRGGRISLLVDAAAPWLLDADGTMPVRVEVQGEVVYEHLAGVAPGREPPGAIDLATPAGRAISQLYARIRDLGSAGGERRDRDVVDVVAAWLSSLGLDIVS